MVFILKYLSEFVLITFNVLLGGMKIYLCVPFYIIYFGIEILIDLVKNDWTQFNLKQNL